MPRLLGKDFMYNMSSLFQIRHLWVISKHGGWMLSFTSYEIRRSRVFYFPSCVKQQTPTEYYNPLKSPRTPLTWLMLFPLSHGTSAGQQVGFADSSPYFGLAPITSLIRMASSLLVLGIGFANTKRFALAERASASTASSGVSRAPACRHRVERNGQNLPHIWRLYRPALGEQPHWRDFSTASEHVQTIQVSLTGHTAA